MTLYGFDSRLSEDYERFLFIRQKGYIPFFQQYWLIEGVPSRLPEDYFDMDLNEMIRLTFYSNGQNWEKYLLWINTLYFQRYGRYYRPLFEILYRYNHKHRLGRFRMNPGVVGDELYRGRGDSVPELRGKLQHGVGLPPPRGLVQWLAREQPLSAPPTGDCPVPTEHPFSGQL